LADVAERFLKKGSTIYVEGRIRKREYEDKEGQKKYMYEILGDSMQMLGGGGRKEDGTNSSQTTEAQKEDVPMVNTPEDDLPF
jgi:single-strand DNA-binding protein